MRTKLGRMKEMRDYLDESKAVNAMFDPDPSLTYRCHMTGTIMENGPGERTDEKKHKHGSVVLCYMCCVTCDV